MPCVQAKLTPLHAAAEQGHLLVVEFLINSGADINAITTVSLFEKSE